MINRFYQEFDTFKPFIDGILLRAQPFMVITLIIAILFIVHKMTENEPSVDEHRILMIIVSFIAVLYYIEISKKITQFCNALTVKVYAVEPKKQNLGETSFNPYLPWGKRTYDEGEYYIVDRHSAIGRLSNKIRNLRLFTGRDKSLETIINYKVLDADTENKYINKIQDKYDMTKNQAVVEYVCRKGISGKVREIIRFIQYIWASILYFLGPVFIIISLVNSKLLTRFLAEFVAINLWPLAIKLVDFMRMSLVVNAEIDNSFFTALKVTYIFVPLMINMIIPGTVANTMLQRVAGFAGVAAGVGSMALRGLRKAIIKV